MPAKRRSGAHPLSGAAGGPDGPASPPPRPARAEPREVVELRALRDAQPELASAIDMQLAFIDIHRRLQSRLPIPTSLIDAARAARHFGEHRPLLLFDEIPLDWTEMRLMVRQTVDILRRFGSIEDASVTVLQAFARDPDRFEDSVRDWYERAAGRPAGDPSSTDAPAADPTGMLDQVLTLAMRPFLARCAETLLPQLDLTAWNAPQCPLCGGEAEFAAITPAAERLLICSRCTGAWPFDPLACPFCRNSDRARITSFASRDGRYRLYACDVCHRYLKAYDGRRAARGVLLAVDSIATLPLDAAAMQKGYTS